jgi:hypothetical protein
MQMALAAMALGLVACSGGGASSAATPAPTASAPAPANVGLSPDLIREAMANGEKSPFPYELTATPGGLVGYLSTPYSRVAYAAAEGKARYRPLTEADIPKLAAPEIEIYAMAHYAQDKVGAFGAETVVIIPRGATDRSLAIHPLRTRPAASEPGFEAPVFAKDVIATFPLSALNRANEVRFIYNVEGARRESAVGLDPATMK